MNNMQEFISKRTKIIATIGPSTEDYNLLKELVLAGVTTIRANFSHGDYQEQIKKFDNAKRISKELNIPVSIMLDTKGPEIRVGKMANGAQEIKANQELVVLTSPQDYKEFEGTSKIITVSYEMDSDLKIGDSILFDDGKLQSHVVAIEKNKVTVITKNAHVLKSNKRVNLPGIAFSLPFLSEKDKQDILFGISQNINYVAASFVNSAENVKELRTLLDENGGKHIEIISKIESTLGLENIDEIIEHSDGIMVARGDLGLEVPYQEVPFQQKRIVRKCRFAGKTVIVATQMLDSMEKSSQPTRAEVSDVYWATELGADATMLSGESAQGQFPLESVRVMATINKRAEKEFYNKLFYSKQLAVITKNSSGHRARIAHNLAHLAYERDIKYTIVLSRTGQLLKNIAKFRPNTAVIGVVNDKNVIGSFGITSSVFVSLDSINFFAAIKKDITKAREVLKPFGAQPGDVFVVVENDKMTEFIY
ncbi:pyruvate kinase [Mesomycoplasma conjunctivae]|uniref:Pyruvate kinase n=1 Tax=Mesomycoplasma conjunctivae (strain ATCC 25834 / NCTC 10147 / HRC/581) TaxID=572263 RepID=C5J5Z3_MESCH|nr:pyruvate kinase [Mesomycoplasma conjunctivae]CAT04885.1 Pyruvate kinase [Mesomycoplasma conjunctivae]VEU65980.1 pyruvate kinase [Mesomycoplasma conjunctivae]